MDNILKLIVGCLGLVGLIVMIVPNSDPLASKKVGAEGIPPAAINSSDAAPAPPPPAAAPQDQDNASGFVVEDYDINNFGKPMVDPTPPGQRNQNTQQQEQTEQQQQSNLAQPQNGGTNSIGPAVPPPPPPAT
jgi:hypothetical protein